MAKTKLSSQKNNSSVFTADDIKAAEEKALKQRKERTAGQIAAAERRRNYTCELYPESCAEDWQQQVENWHVPCLAILHDKDVDEHGQPKKEHIHLLVMFDVPQSYPHTVIPMFESLKAAFPKDKPISVTSKFHYARYLCHLDSPKKHQYDPSEVMEFGGASYADLALSDMSQVEINRVHRNELTRLIVVMCPKDLTSLVNFCTIYKAEWIDSICKDCTYYVNSLIRDLKESMTYHHMHEWSIFAGHLIDEETGEEVRPFWESDFVDPNEERLLAKFPDLAERYKSDPVPELVQEQSSDSSPVTENGEKKEYEK